MLNITLRSCVGELKHSDPDPTIDVKLRRSPSTKMPKSLFQFKMADFLLERAPGDGFRTIGGPTITPRGGAP